MHDRVSIKANETGAAVSTDLNQKNKAAVWEFWHSLEHTEIGQIGAVAYKYMTAKF